MNRKQLVETIEESLAAAGIDEDLLAEDIADDLEARFSLIDEEDDSDDVLGDDE